MNKILRVWWMPQVQCDAFYVHVESFSEGVMVMNVLANYDLFQFEHNIKPDYCGSGGIEQRLCDMGQEWESWEDEDTGEDDPAAFLLMQEAT